MWGGSHLLVSRDGLAVGSVPLGNGGERVTVGVVLTGNNIKIYIIIISKII